MAKPTRLSEIEIAREALGRLASRKIPPTPDNYRALYLEISGEPPALFFPEREFKALLAALPRKSPAQNRFARQLETAIGKGNWDSVGAALSEVLAASGGEQPHWPSLIRDLVQQLETHHAGLTTTKKREALEHILSVSTASDLLVTRLQSLIQSWSKTSVAGKPDLTAPIVAMVPATTAAQAAATLSAKDGKSLGDLAWQGGIVDLRELVAQLLDNTLSIVLRDKPDLASEASQIALSVRAARNAEALIGLSERLKKLCYRAHFVAEDQAELSTALMHLMQLIMENIGELVIEDQWLSGQIQVLRDLILQPLDLRRLDDLERRMKDVIVKQSSLKKSLNEARDRLKLMLATFVDHLGDFSDATAEYQGKIEDCSDKISKARDISELTDVLAEVMQETRVVQVNTARSREELSAMRSRVMESEQVVARLQTELSSASDLVRHDPLTGALNRKGLNEALDKELARLRRQGGTLSLALLDVDNFKQVNDTQGHATGDAALTHLATVVREAVRPEDTVARYGGEEFVVLLPNTGLEEAVAVMTRVQRELTRRIFMHQNNRILITFSCGVAETASDENPEVALKRADAAMYQAKRAGKNRVIPG